MTTVAGTSQITTPLGHLWSIYADFTASGVPHPDIERFINGAVHPYYANTHSNAHNGQLMQSYIDQSKEIIRRSVNACPRDRIIMTGNGCTGAIIHLIHLLDLRHRTSPYTVVFVSVAEHHSNYLPWKHLPVKLVVVPLLDSGLIDTKFLSREMTRYRKGGHPVICSFIAGSNVTGVIQPFYAISKLVHQAGGLIFWDFAGCGPYVPIDMHNDKETYFDAIMLSPHKMLGGPGTPGLLVANDTLFRNAEPFYPGGGTVRFVCKTFTHYSSNLEKRESGGTPDIIGCIRAGMAFQLKDRIIHRIMKHEDHINKLVRAAVRRWQKEIPGRVTMLNPDDKWNTPQVPIYSFIIKGLHYNFVVALLNDFFGVQSRGGVSCCSLYAQHLLHISQKREREIYGQITQEHGVPKDYGWCRVTFHYTMTDDMVHYVLQALEAVARHGSKWLSSYTYDEGGNRWSAKGWSESKPERVLDYRQGDEVLAKVSSITSELLKGQLDSGIIKLSSGPTGK